MRSSRISTLLKVGLAIATLVVSTFPSGADAYSLRNCRFPENNSAHGDDVYVRKNSLTTDISSAVSSAVSDWNGAQNEIDFFFGTPSRGVEFYDATYGTIGWNATTEYPSCFHTVYNGNVEIKFNLTYLSGLGANRLRSTANHELGHALALQHTGSLCGSPAIMYASGARYTTCGWYTPRPDDINGVNARYYP